MNNEPRSAAARCVAAVLAGRSLDDALSAQESGLDAGGARLLRALSYGVLREHGLLQSIVAQMLERPLEDEAEVAALIEVGLYQLRSMRVSSHAAVSETVSACIALGRPGHRKLVNALLRRYQRERDSLDAAAASDASRTYSYPTWLLDSIRCDWPECWQAVLEAGNQQGPMTLRVNRSKLSARDYQAQLKAVSMDATPVRGAPDALVLDKACTVTSLPCFDQGQVFVQDASAQLAASVLQLEAGQRVLDACCAPGGKTTHILECADVELLGLDSDARRIERVKENLSRQSLEANLHVADAGQFPERWDGPAFDRILLDAPCSGTGVIRRHPDIKWLRRHDDIPRMALEQERLLSSLWQVLAPGGLLVYATCSILEAEGDGVIRQFLLKQANARVDKIHARWGEATRFGRRIAPGGAFDGFYYCRLRK